MHKNRRREGYEEGKQDGLIEGAREKTIETAKNFLKENIPVETISRCVGLPLEEVQKLAEEVGKESL